MNAVNRILGSVTDGVLYPFRGLPPLVGLAVVSLLVGILMLLIFKVTSNQTKMKLIKDRISAGFYEIRLMNDDLRAILRAQSRILSRNLHYLRYALVPLLWIIVPIILIMGQLQAYYGYRGLAPGETALVEVELEDDWRERTGTAGPGRPDIELRLPEGLALDAPGVWIPARREMAWRIAAREWGDHEIQLVVGGETYAKAVHVTEDTGRRAPYRSAGFLDQLFYPGEEGLPGSSPIARIRLRYEDAEIGVLGLGMHWLIPFLALSIVFAFALKDRFGVTI